MIREEWTAVTAGWATFCALALVVCYRLVVAAIHTYRTPPVHASDPRGIDFSNHTETTAITHEDLKKLMEELDDLGDDGAESWELVVQRRSDGVSYLAKRRDPKDGGITQYRSTTIFEKCSSKVVRDFYMDSDFRAEWDKTLLLHKQLEINPDTGIEIGQFVKKFPLLSPREYVLVWRIWEAEDESFYCILKACEHKLAPKQSKYKRVEVYKSGWCIRNVKGRDACEITMLHQEDIGIQKDMAKLTFSRGIWSYVTKMDINLRQYASRTPHLHKGINAVALAHQVPRLLQKFVIEHPSSEGIEHSTALAPVKKAWSKRRIAKGLLLLGGALVVMQGKSSVWAKIATACVVNRVVKPPRSVSAMFRRPTT